MKKIKRLAGFRDLLPEEASLKHAAIDRIKDVFKSFDYQPIETPHIEYAKLISDDDDNAENNKQIYRFEDNGGRDVALRFDHTVPLARFIGEHFSQLGKPFKRYVIGNVFRGENPQAGRYREFTQCDFDCLGTESIHSDAEILQVIYHCFNALEIDDFIININHRLLLEGLIKSFDAEAKQTKILQITDKIDKITKDKAIQLLQQEVLLNKSQAEKWLQIVSLDINNFSQLKSFVDEYIQDIEIKQKLLDDASRLYQILAGCGMDSARYSWNVKIARGILYYTGLVFETFISSAPKLGAVCSGGRYDKLAQKLSDVDYPGVGASIGLDRLLNHLKDSGRALVADSCKLLLAVIDDDLYPFANQLATKCRETGLIAAVYPNVAKLKKQFDYAAKLNYRYLVACGQNEKDGEGFILADLKDGKKTKFDDFASLLKNIKQS